MVKRVALPFISNNCLFSARGTRALACGGNHFPDEMERVFASENRRKGSPFKGVLLASLGAPLKGMIPPTASSLAGRRGECRFSRAMVMFAETRLSSEAGKGGGSIGYGRLLSVHVEGRKLAVEGH